MANLLEKNGDTIMRNSLSSDEAVELCVAHGTDINPFGMLNWTLGSADNFICFDYAVLRDGTVVLGSDVTSDSSCFTEAFRYVHVDVPNALAEAEEMVSEAREWCEENEVNTEESNEDEWLNELKSFLPTSQYGDASTT